MARVTVEGCLEQLDNRFELVLAATQRARQLKNGFEATIPWDNDKETVVALREFEAGTVDPKELDAIEHAREQASQAAEAGVSDNFMTGADLTTLSSATDGVSASPETVQNTEMNVPEIDDGRKRYTLRSEPSIFEQVASRSGPVDLPLPDGANTTEGVNNDQTPDDNQSDDS